MVASNKPAKGKWIDTLKEVIGFDLRSLALFRICLASIVLADLIIRFSDLTAHYSGAGILPLAQQQKISASPFYWSIFALSDQPFVQAILFILAILIALALLVGYRTRLATIATWAMVISLHNRNPLLLFAADDVLRAVLFWSMFLPLGANYSIDSALNTSPNPLPKRFVSGATFAFMVQICFIYMWSAAFKTKSETWWPDGTAVYYALSFDRYATHFGQFLLSLPQALLKVMTFFALCFEWLGPLLIFIPFYNSFFRIVAIVAFVFLHINFGLTFRLGIFSYLSIAHWLPFIPSQVWDTLNKKLQTPAREGLKINYDADCGFCKKMVYLLRTFLILPRTPLLVAQDNPSIYADMLEKNSWVVEDWQGKRHYKWEAITYICSLSPIFWFLAPILRWKPLMSLGTKFYETIASNRRIAGNFTKPFKFRPLEVRSPLPLTILALLLLAYTSVWNLRSFVKQTVEREKEPSAWVRSLYKLLYRKTFNLLDPIGRVTRLDQYWSIFAPSPPQDDGWHIAVAKLEDGSEVDLFREGKPVSWEKPTIEQVDRQYRNMQWRSYFISLNRAAGRNRYPDLGSYLCRQWNAQHNSSKQIKTIDIYFMDERTVAPGEKQTVEKKLIWQQDCLKRG